MGVYHAAGGNVKDGHNTSAFSVGSWGIVAPVNAPMDSGMTFREDLEFHCRTADVNALYGMLVAQSEGGVFSNPKDTDPWAPLNLSKACGRATGGSKGCRRSGAGGSALEHPGPYFLSTDRRGGDRRLLVKLPGAVPGSVVCSGDHARGKWTAHHSRGQVLQLPG